MVYIKPSRAWLFVDKFFNAVAGSKKFGLPSGKLYHFAGKKHGGKSALVAWLCAWLQRRQNVFVIWIDLEESFDKPWFHRLGMLLREEFFYLIYPKIVKLTVATKRGKITKKKGQKVLQSAEMLLAEAEAIMDEITELYPKRKLALVIDSVANMQPDKKIDAGMRGGNMNTNIARAALLSDALPRLIWLAKNYNMWVFLINQIRTNPAVMFGDPEYSPGGNALDHNSHVMIRIRRKGSGFDKGTVAPSISGYMKNYKNKAGGGSLESQLCSYYIRFDKPWKQIFKFGKIKEKA